MTTEISTGFQEDCFIFVEKFIKTQCLEFSSFCSIWNSLNFHHIFYGRYNVEELNSFLEEASIIIKRLLIRSSHVNEKICCLYLLYGIFVKQPDQNGPKIRVTLSDWIGMKDFYESLTEPDHEDAVAVFHTLIDLNAYHFCLMDTKSFIDKDKHAKSHDVDPELVFKPIAGQVLHDLDGLNSKDGIFNALELLEIAYNEMKEQLAVGNENIDAGLPPSTLLLEIKDSMGSIQEILQKSSVQKRRRRRKSSRIADSQFDKSEDEAGRNIKDKRDMIKAKALKVQKKSRLTTDSTEGELLGAEEKKKKGAGSSNKRDDLLRDPKHFRKFTTVRQIFEHNVMLNEEVKEQLKPGTTKTESVYEITFLPSLDASLLGEPEEVLKVEKLKLPRKPTRKKVKQEIPSTSVVKEEK